MKEISQDQAIEIRKTILQEFHNLCEKMDLHYSLAYGTLLGAVRHGGMIPWDDDIDLVMPRADYERLCQMYPDVACKDRYQFISHHNHPEVKTKIGYFIDFTTITETAGKKNDYHGIHIDVYPLDIVPNGQLQQKWLFFQRRLAHFLIKVKDLHPEVMKGKQKLIRQIAQVIFMPFSSEKAYKWLHSLSRKYMNMPEEERKTVCCLVEAGKPVTFPYDLTGQYTTYPYDGSEFCAFKNYDSPLRAWYGEYMTLPPVEQRKRPAHKWVHYYFKDEIHEESI